MCTKTFENNRIAKSKSDAAFSSEVRTDVKFEFWIRVFNKAYNFLCNMTWVYVPKGSVCVCVFVLACVNRGLGLWYPLEESLVFGGDDNVVW